MPSTIVVRDTRRGTADLLVEVHEDAEAVPVTFAQDFFRRLFERNIRVGLIATPKAIMVVRDTISSVEFAESRFASHSFDSNVLFSSAGLPSAEVGAGFVGQVRDWLTQIGSSWHASLPKEALSWMVPDVVGHLSDADLESRDGLIELPSAAE
jgi:hypothetical protein